MAHFKDDLAAATALSQAIVGVRGLAQWVHGIDWDRDLALVDKSSERCEFCAVGLDEHASAIGRDRGWPRREGVTGNRDHRSFWLQH